MANRTVSLGGDEAPGLVRGGLGDPGRRRRAGFARPDPARRRGAGPPRGRGRRKLEGGPPDPGGLARPVVRLAGGRRAVEARRPPARGSGLCPPARRPVRVGRGAARRRPPRARPCLAAAGRRPPGQQGRDARTAGGPARRLVRRPLDRGGRGLAPGPGRVARAGRPVGPRRPLDRRRGDRPGLHARRADVARPRGPGDGRPPPGRAAHGLPLVPARPRPPGDDRHVPGDLARGPGLAGHGRMGDFAAGRAVPDRAVVRQRDRLLPVHLLAVRRALGRPEPRGGDAGDAPPGGPSP